MFSILLITLNHMENEIISWFKLFVWESIEQSCGEINLKAALVKPGLSKLILQQCFDIDFTQRNRSIYLLIHKTNLIGVIILIERSCTDMDISNTTASTAWTIDGQTEQKMKDRILCDRNSLHTLDSLCVCLKAVFSDDVHNRWHSRQTSNRHLKLFSGDPLFVAQTPTKQLYLQGRLHRKMVRTGGSSKLTPRALLRRPLALPDIPPQNVAMKQEHTACFPVLTIQAVFLCCVYSLARALSEIVCSAVLTLTAQNDVRDLIAQVRDEHRKIKNVAAMKLLGLSHLKNVSDLGLHCDIDPPVKHFRPSSHRVWCYAILKSTEYTASAISAYKQQQLDKMDAQEFIETVTCRLNPEEKESVMCHERQRRRTFLFRWTHESYLPGKEMAAAGFYALYDSDKVQCVFCRGVLHNWLPGDRAADEHSKHFRSCPFVRGAPCGNKPCSGDGEFNAADMKNIRYNNSLFDATSSSPENPLQKLGINTQKAARPEYAAEPSRIKTFGRFPECCPVPAKDICEAGFFYTGFDDTVKCFWCEGALQRWEEGDNPWVEHARHFAECHFLNSKMGAQFVKDVKDGKYQKGTTGRGHPSLTRPDYTEMINTCSHMGYQMADIQKIISQNRNHVFLNVQDMLEALHELEDHGVTANEESMIISDEAAAVCKMCKKEPLSHICLPCGCMSLCTSCAKPELETCPSCKGNIAGVMKIFLA